LIAREAQSAVAYFWKLEAKRSADRIGFGEAQGEALADTVGIAAFVADQLTRGLIVAEIFLAQSLRENETVSAEVLDRGEEAEGLHTGDAALHELADLIREESSNVAIDRLAFGLHRGPL